MNFLRRFMYGRNGADHLAVTFLAVGCVISIASRFVPSDPLRAALTVLDYVCLVLCFFRMFSRNVYKRQQENRQFVHFFRQLAGHLHLRPAVSRVRNSREYKYFKCPHCGLQLRAPRGRGKIRVTCQQCGEGFERKV